MIQPVSDRDRSVRRYHGCGRDDSWASTLCDADWIWQAICWTLLTSHEFISSRGNEYFCEIDEEYLTDRFNLTGLQTEVHYYQHALDLITDVFDLDCEDDMRETIEKSARHLYGLVHARYIVTTRGLTKMVCQPILDPMCWLFRSTNSRNVILANVHASIVILNHFCQWDCQTYHIKSRSNCTALDVKTFTIRNHPVMLKLMVHILVHPFTTYSFRFIQHWFHKRVEDDMNHEFLVSKFMQVLH